MARQPFFTGNYGSALAQVDTRPIMEGARAQAAMYQNLGQSLGQNIGGAIEKYGLNKEQQKKDKGFLKGAITGIKSLKEGDPNPQNDMMYDAILAGAEDENIPLVQRVAQMKQGQQQINLTGQQDMQQSLISSRKTAEDAQRQSIGAAAKLKDDQDFANQSLLKEQREVQNTLATLSPEDRANASLTGRTKWLNNLSTPLLERGAVPIKNAIFDPAADRYRNLQMEGLEFQQKQRLESETAFPASERARLEKEGKETDIRYKEGMMRPAGPESVTKRIADLDSEAKSILSGAAWAKDDEGNSLKLEDLIDYDPITEGIVLSDKASGFASQDFDRLKSLVQEKGDLRLGQKMRVVMTDGTTKEMTGREYQKLKADSEMKEADRIAKEKQKARSKEQEKSAYGERLYN
jgi:hypothetical protein